MRLIGSSRNTRFSPFGIMLCITLSGSGQPPDCSLPSPIWFLGWAASCAPSDGHYGIAGRVQGAKHQQEASSAPHLPVPAEKAGNHATQSGLV